MTTNTEVLPRIFTPCRDCVFATYRNKNTKGELVNVQDGCLLGRLEVYPETVLVEQDDISYYEIEGRICNTFRPQVWADQHKDEDLVTTVLKDVQFSYDYIINLHDSFRNIEALTYNVNLACKNEIKPRNIVIVKHNDSKLSSLDLFRPFKNVKEQYGIKVSIENVYDDNNDLNKMNKAVARCNSMYFVWQDGVFPLITNEFTNKLNVYLNFELKRFIMIEDEDGMFTVCHKQAFDNVGANAKRVGFDKVKQLAKEQDTEYLIKKYSEL